MSRSRGLRLAGLALSGTLALIALKTEAGAQEDGTKRFIAGLRADKAMTEALSACPTDLAPSASKAPSGWPPKNFCAGQPETCLAACRTRSDAGRCMALGLVLSANLSATTKQIDAETIFSAACAAGAQLGCTNRAAGISLPQPEDPWRLRSPADRISCAIKTFEAGCDRKEPWACAMLGGAYEKGEGVARDTGTAVQLYKMTCALSAYSDACDVIKPSLQALDKAK